MITMNQNNKICSYKNKTTNFLRRNRDNLNRIEQSNNYYLLNNPIIRPYKEFKMTKVMNHHQTPNKNQRFLKSSKELWKDKKQQFFDLISFGHGGYRVLSDSIYAIDLISNKIEYNDELNMKILKKLIK